MYRKYVGKKVLGRDALMPTKSLEIHFLVDSILGMDVIRNQSNSQETFVVDTKSYDLQSILVI